MDKPQVGQTVSVHYVGTFDDSTQFDSSREREEPLKFQVGSGQVIPGFDAAILEMTVGETKNIRLEPSEAYGEIVPTARQQVPRTAFSVDYEPTIGAVVRGSNQTGEQMIARIETIEDDTITLDFNHALAGKTLNFEMELLEISNP